MTQKAALLLLAASALPCLVIAGIFLRGRETEQALRDVSGLIRLGQPIAEALALADRRHPELAFSVVCTTPKGFIFSGRHGGESTHTMGNTPQLQKDPREWGQAVEAELLRLACDLPTIEVASERALEIRLDKDLRVLGIGEPYRVD